MVNHSRVIDRETDRALVRAALTSTWKTHVVSPASPSEGDRADAARLKPDTTVMRRLLSHQGWFFSAAPANCATAPSVVCAALSPSRKSLSEKVA